MDIVVKTENSVEVVTITGEIDGNTAPQVQNQIQLLANPNAKIILDMTEVPYMSSAGLRVLLAAYRGVVGQGGQVALVGLAEEIKDTMAMTGFLDFFSHFDSLAEGIATLVS